MDTEFKEDIELYSMRYENLSYNTDYFFAVRGINTNITSLESEAIWYPFRTPTCWELHKTNVSKCGPHEIGGFTVEFNHIENHVFNVNVTWSAPKHQPDSYSLELRDMHPLNEAGDLERVFNFTIERVNHGFYNCK